MLDGCKSLLKLPKHRRDQKVVEHNLNVLFDISSCKHGSQACDCPKDKKVPHIWKDFLFDQQTERKLYHNFLIRLMKMHLLRKLKPKLGGREETG